MRTYAAVVVGPRAHLRHFRTPRERRAGPRNARTESRPRERGVAGMARHTRETDLPLEVRHGEVRAHRGVNPGTRLLFPLPPAAADRHLIFFTLSRKTAQKGAKLQRPPGPPGFARPETTPKPSCARHGQTLSARSQAPVDPAGTRAPRVAGDERARTSALALVPGGALRHGEVLGAARPTRK